jgi:hypothetical protein
MLRAMKAQNYCGVEKQRIADEQERIISKSIGIPRTRDNSAFDMRNDDVGIELKTMQIMLHKRYHVDHVMPLSKDGLHDKDNIQLLCPKCNLSKAAKDPYEWA